MAAYSSQLHIGPLPPPDDLIRYNDAFPGCAERIVTMAERQSQHRQERETVVIDGNNRRETQGQWMAFVISILVIVGGLLLIYNNKSTQGLVAVLVPVAGLAGMFFVKRSSERKKVQEKHRDAQGNSG